MNGSHRLRWKDPVDGISGVHAIGYPSNEEAYAAAARESYALGWNGRTEPVHGPGYPAPSRETDRSDTIQFCLVIALIAAILIKANLG
jgi:hypothetical protein